jgi:hypothetical protein
LKKSGNQVWVFIVLLLAGALVGALLWLLALQFLPSSWNVSLPVGFEPATVNLHIVTLTFGFKLLLNPGSAVGMIAVLVGWFWKR